MLNRIMFNFFITGCVLVMILRPSITDSSLSNKKAKVVIVGAGLAGIGAAQRLLLNNITDVTVLEAMDQIGGRIRWINLGRFGDVDMGAHWIHGQRGNVVYDIAQPLGLVNHSGDYKNLMFFRSDGSNLKLPLEFFALYENLFSEVHTRDNINAFKSFKDLSDTRLEKFGRSTGLSAKDTKLLQRQAAMNLCTLQGCGDLSDVSVKASRDYQTGTGDVLIHWTQGGMTNILDLLIGTHNMSPWKGLDWKNKVKVTSRVSKVDWSRHNGPVVIKTQSGSVLSADFVIFTPSLNVLKYKHNTLFTPPLHIDKVHAIQALGMDVVDKVYLVFQTRWWPQHVNGFIPLYDSDYVSSSQDWGQGIISFVGENHNPLVLGAWLAGDAARAMERASDYEVRTTVMRVLRQRVSKTFFVPEPVFIIRSRWWENQDVIGSYSYNSITSEKLISPRKTLSAPLTGKNGRPMVLFAGEATSFNHYGTVNGALESGWREAQRIIDYINTNRRTA